MLPVLASPFHHLHASLARWRTPQVPTDPPDAPFPLAQPDLPLPAWVAQDPVVHKYQALLGQLPWADFPERPPLRSQDRPWPGPRPDPRAPCVAAFLVKLHEGKRSMSDLRAYLLEHPALVYLLGFPRCPDPSAPHGFNVEATVPDRRQLSRVLRTLPNDALQFLLTATVELLRASLPAAEQATFGDTIAGDTQAILAWVKENNPKQYIKEGRLDKTRQPTGDPDCKLGVKARHNSPPKDEHDALPTPAKEAKPASQLQVGVDILWGYAAGIVVTRLPDKTEVVLAERTRPFNESDISYFFPLMKQVEGRLGRRPRIGIWDAAYDAHYVYDYFDQAGGQAVVPLVAGRRGSQRQFAADGAPLCAAGLAMPRLFVYEHRTGLYPHEREKCGCPLLHPQPSGEPCPIADPHFAKGGCTTTLAASRGARIRHQLDRTSDAYKQLYDQRTMVERINSQAEALEIIHPKLRSGRAIANRNTLTYVLINLRALMRLRAAAEERQSEQVKVLAA
jgi:Transposase DDE domain